MVDTVFFVLQIIAVGVLLYWAVTRDKKGDDAAQTGLLAMRRTERDDSRQQAPASARQRAPIVKLGGQGGMTLDDREGDLVGGRRQPGVSPGRRRSPARRRAADRRPADRRQ